jgi:hypothetical protein
VSSLRVADEDLVQGEVDVLDPEAKPLEKAHAGAVQEGCDELRGSVEPAEELVDLVAGENDRKAVGTSGVGDLAEVGEGPA